MSHLLVPLIDPPGGPSLDGLTGFPLHGHWFREKQWATCCLRWSALLVKPEASWTSFPNKFFYYYLFLKPKRNFLPEEDASNSAKPYLVWFKKRVTHHSVFITHHSSLSFHHLSLITHHLKHPTPFGIITHLSSLNIFQLFVGFIHVPCASFTLFIYYFSFNSQYPNSPN